MSTKLTRPSDVHIGMMPGAVSVTQADITCRDCGYDWRQCEIGTGYGSISPECPICGGKAKPGGSVEWRWSPPQCLVVWSELEVA